MDTNGLHQPVMRAVTFGDRVFVSTAPNFGTGYLSAFEKLKSLHHSRKKSKHSFSRQPTSNYLSQSVIEFVY